MLERESTCIWFKATPYTPKKIELRAPEVRTGYSMPLKNPRLPSPLQMQRKSGFLAFPYF